MAKSKSDKNVLVPTKLKEFDVRYPEDLESACLLLDNEDGAKFATILEPEHARRLLAMALEIAAEISNPGTADDSDATKETVRFAVSGASVRPGRKADEVDLHVDFGTARLSILMDLDLFISLSAEVVREVEPNPEIPDKLQ